MSQFKAPSNAALAEIRGEFVALGSARDLINDSNKENTSIALPMSDLYAYATGQISYPNVRIEKVLARMPGLRSAFRRITMSQPTYRFGRAVAASDGTPSVRQTKGAKIKFSSSRAHEEMTYIIIELTSVSKKRISSMTVFDSDDKAVRVNLPIQQGGIIQLLVRKDSDILLALENPDTNIVLM